MLILTDPSPLGLFLIAILTMGASCSSCERAVVTSPLVGAKRVHVVRQGRVAQMLKVRGYTYLRLADAEHGQWHVISSDAPTLGQVVQIKGYAEVRQYHSPSLNRRFDHLLFSTVSKPSKEKP